MEENISTLYWEKAIKDNKLSQPVPLVFRQKNNLFGSEGVIVKPLKELTTIELRARLR